METAVTPPTGTHVYAPVATESGFAAGSTFPTTSGPDHTTPVLNIVIYDIFLQTKSGLSWVFL